MLTGMMSSAMFISVVAVISQAVGNANRSMERQPSLRTRDTLRRPRLPVSFKHLTLPTTYNCLY